VQNKEKMKNPIPSVDLLITRNSKILLGKLNQKWTNNGKYEYGLPGREIKFGDNFQRSIESNLREELGMTLKSFKIFCINNNFGFGNHYVSIGILVEAEGNPEVKKSEDWKEWKWFEKDDIPSKLFPSAELTIKCFLENRFTLQ